MTEPKENNNISKPAAANDGNNSRSAASGACCSLEERLDRLAALMEARGRGEVGNDVVEQAVSGVLLASSSSSETTAATTTTPQHNMTTTNNNNTIQEDTDDYDNFDTTSERKQSSSSPATTTPSSSKPVMMTETFPPKAQLTLESMLASTTTTRQQTPPQQDKTKITIGKTTTTNDNDALLSAIPLGRQGARMLVTFGDGRHPKPETVRAALCGARKCLQTAIRDARALRRRSKVEYERARHAVRLGNGGGGGGKKRTNKRKGVQFQHPTTLAAVDATMLYRAMAGYDRLAYDPKCGFDIDQLRQLYPEEMNAYGRWKQMHKAYEASSSKDEEGAVSASENDDAPDTETESLKKEETTSSSSGALLSSGGHLEERAAQFDMRTDQMADEWYLKFSEVRQGSFLPRRKGKISRDERRWDAANRQRASVGRARSGVGTWQNMSATSIRFLHWIGFDPRSALPPPNEETTLALGFLGYDFMGKIVEKAIYLRNVEKQKQAGKDSGDKEEEDVLLELSEGEQLEAADIERALNHPGVKPVPLYSSATPPNDRNLLSAAQLYFGPGFEDRLEMEMEEMVSSSSSSGSMRKKQKTMSGEEQEIQEKEDLLFSQLEKKPPEVLESVSQFIVEDDDNNDTDEDNVDDNDEKGEARTPLTQDGTSK